jgi:hypothetical protein
MGAPGVLGCHWGAIAGFREVEPTDRQQPLGTPELPIEEAVLRTGSSRQG